MEYVRTNNLFSEEFDGGMNDGEMNEKIAGWRVIGMYDYDICFMYHKY